jgi:hypothetical protein
MVPRGFGIPPIRCRLSRARRTCSFARSLEATLNRRELTPKRVATPRRLLTLLPGLVALSHSSFKLLPGFITLTYHQLQFLTSSCFTPLQFVANIITEEDILLTPIAF